MGDGDWSRLWYLSVKELLYEHQLIAHGHHGIISPLFIGGDLLAILAGTPVSVLAEGRYRWLWQTIRRFSGFSG